MWVMGIFLGALLVSIALASRTHRRGATDNELAKRDVQSGKPWSALRRPFV